MPTSSEIWFFSELGNAVAEFTVYLPRKNTNSNNFWSLSFDLFAQGFEEIEVDKVAGDSNGFWKDLRSNQIQISKFKNRFSKGVAEVIHGSSSRSSHPNPIWNASYASGEVSKRLRRHLHQGSPAI